LSAADRLAEARLATKRLFLDGEGALTADAKVYFAAQYRFCAKKQASLARDKTGHIDPYLSFWLQGAAAMLDRTMALLELHPVINLLEEEREHERDRTEPTDHAVAE